MVIFLYNWVWLYFYIIGFGCIFFQERWFQLIIRSILANDFGTYICEGVNDYGVGTAEIELFRKCDSNYLIKFLTEYIFCFITDYNLW